jgi:hypothetical protein
MNVDTPIVCILFLDLFNDTMDFDTKNCGGLVVYKEDRTRGLNAS